MSDRLPFRGTGSVRSRIGGFLLVSLCAVFVHAGNCNPSSTPVATIEGTVAGVVRIDGTGAPGIQVSLDGGVKVMTLGDGEYAFATVPAGSHTISISGFPSDVTFESTSETATISTEGQLTEVDFEGMHTTGTPFTAELETGFEHPAGQSSNVCGRLHTIPSQPGVSFEIDLTGPGVVGSGQAKGHLSSAGDKNFTLPIEQYGTYHVNALVDSGSAKATATSTVEVTATAPGCP